MTPSGRTSQSPPAALPFSPTGESGQAAIALVVILSMFLLGTVALSVDFTNMWFHRQAEQAAADSACQAGALDLLATASGLSLSKTGFTPGTAGDCASSPGATMCFYANANGYDGAGLTAGAASNAVSWSFPASVAGVTAPSSSQATNPFLTVSIAENVRTYFVSLFNLSKYQQIDASATCGVIGVNAAAPMVVLHPTMAGSFYYSGGGTLSIFGGPQRSLQVNSSSATAVEWLASGVINLSQGGPSQTGSDVAIVGGPASAPSGGYSGGTTGSWKSNALPVADPFGSVPVPASIKSLTPSTTTSGAWVPYLTDGCPDHSGSTGNPAEACKEFAPGYYPNGINLASVMNDYSTAIFLPGIYYLNGSLSASHSDTMRVAKPAGYQRTDGVMFYFLSGSLSISGGSGLPNSGIDNVAATDLTCDGSAPAASLGMPSTLSGNVLTAQCAANGTYWDAGGDTTDSRGAPGSRGLLVFQDHADTTNPTFGGSGNLTFSGVLYFHSTGYGDVLSLSGGSSSGAFVLGEIVADQISLTGSGKINLALNPAPTTNMLKVGMFQ
ncbi:MAG TPA: Tad domain-containing protein [Acidobacteriaceae bacterium]|nr:Tad domain-containing protein [Acidobacteriaceae bacterium]